MTFKIACLSKISVLFLFITIKNSAEAASHYLSSTDGTNQASHQNLYSVLPQTFYVPEQYQKYLTSSSQKYVPASENQIPASISTTDKAVLSPTYKATLDTTKYVASQLTKPTQVGYSGQGNYPYLYTIAKVVPSTGTVYSSVGDTKSSYYEEVPKKYHYGYRVSDAHSGNEFGHSEVHDGHSAKGYYHVLLPDGRLQNVKYWAGPSGYHATITYESKY